MNPTDNSTPWPSAKGVTAVLDDVLSSAQPPRKARFPPPRAEHAAPTLVA